MKYYIVSPNHTETFENYTQLVNFLSGKNYKGLFKFRNSVFDRVKVSENDVYYGEREVEPARYTRIGNIYIRAHEYGYIHRDVRIIDEFGNNAYNDILIYDVNHSNYRDDIECERRKHINDSRRTSYYFKGKYHFYNKLAEPEFRRDPVPYTGHRRHSKYYRFPHTFQELKQRSDPELKDFCRKGRNDIPTTWDDQVRSRAGNYNWKSCTKNRHQWENKAKGHHHMDVYKITKNSEEDQVDESA